MSLVDMRLNGNKLAINKFWLEMRRWPIRLHQLGARTAFPGAVGEVLLVKLQLK